MAYKKWRLSELSMALVPDLTKAGIATVEFTTPNGSITIMGEPRDEERVSIVEGVHMSSQGIAPNDIGLRNLRVLARFVMKELDYDVLHIEGEARTTGANPSHRPRPMRFERGRHDPA